MSPLRAVLAAASAPGPSSAPGPAVTQAGVLRSEWLKLRSLRSMLLTMVMAAGSMGLLALVGAIDFGSDWDAAPVAARAALDPMDDLLGGWFLAQVLIGVIGALAVTSEYASGSVAATFAAVPRRVPVLVAKLLVPAAATFVVVVPATLASVLVAGLVLPDGAAVDLGAPGVLRGIVGVGIAMAAVAALGTALGFLVRSTAGAIGILVVVLLVLPGLVSGFSEDLYQVLPAGAIRALVTVDRVDPELAVLSWPAGLALLTGYVVVAVAAAATVLRRRDV